VSVLKPFLSIAVKLMGPSRLRMEFVKLQHGMH
jgi:hypothetical protein